MSYCNLFVAKLPRSVTDKDLEHVFAEYNPISAKVMLDASTGKSKGFGFVLFNTEQEGKRAYEELNHKQTSTNKHNFILTICPSEHSGKTALSLSTALYIRNIPITVPQKQVREFLSTFGDLLCCTMRSDHHGNPVWVVYAEYDCLECSTGVLQRLHGNSEYFGVPPIMVKYAESKEAKLERRHRRKEGKTASAKIFQEACAFPPPKPPHFLPPCTTDAGTQAERAKHHQHFLDFTAAPCISHNSSESRTDAPSGCGNSDGSPCVSKTVFSQELATCSAGKNHYSDVSSNSSSVYKVVENVFASSRPSMPLMYPMRTQKVLMMQQKVDNSNVFPAMIVLEKGQKFMLPPDFATVPAVSFTPPSGNVFVPLPVSNMCLPLPISNLFTANLFS